MLPLVNANLRTALQEMRYLPRALRMVSLAAGRWHAAWLAALAVQGLLPVAIVALTRPLVDRLAGVVAGDHSLIEPLLVIAAAMAALLAARELCGILVEYVATGQRCRVTDYVATLIQAKSASVDLAFYEWPEFHDRLHRARAGAMHRPAAILENCGVLVQNGITLAAMAALLLPYGAWISIALVLSCAPALVVFVRSAVRHHRWQLCATPRERRAAYLDWLVGSAHAAAELRLYSLGAHFRAAYARLRKELAAQELGLSRSHALAELGAAALALSVAFACVAWMFTRALAGEMSLGDVALFYFAFNQGQSLMHALLGSVGRLYRQLLFLADMFAFLDMPNRVAESAQALPPERASGRGPKVAFRDVTFRYPGSERAVLRNVDLEIEAGSIAAIVGPNGAGKSTLLKMLCRFYDPDGGRVEYGGTDLRDFGLEGLRSQIAMLFQDPVRYEATVAENIALPGRGAKRGDVEDAARAAGAEALILRLPRGYDTPLGQCFSGSVDLSVGEWQRIALARAFLRPAPLLLLDEPTSAMDSWAEADWLERLRHLALGRTAIVVTHRFTTAMRADVIHVMDNGRVVESGSHAQLVARGDVYARSWHAQMRAGMTA